MHRYLTPLFAVIIMLLSIALVVTQVRQGHAVEVDLTPPVVPAGGCWHRVRDGETLRTISRDYFGSARHWRLIHQANGAEPQPTAGTVLWIPATFGSESALLSEHSP